MVTGGAVHRRNVIACIPLPLGTLKTLLEELKSVHVFLVESSAPVPWPESICASLGEVNVA